MTNGLQVTVEERGAERVFHVSADERRKTYLLLNPGQQEYLDLFQRLAGDFGTRLPRSRESLPAVENDRWQVLLGENLSPSILYGYGDPAVLRAEGAYYLYVTSNDAPDAFPILRSPDLEHWEHKGFLFPAGRAPSWADTKPLHSDFWAPEVQPIGGRYVACFTAREKDGTLSVGLACSPSPAGPFEPCEKPLIRGGVIDAHIFVDGEAPPILFWKEDNNDVWPIHLAELLVQRPGLLHRMFPHPEDAATASVAAAMSPWLRMRAPMERFFALQPLIEATVERYSEIRELLREGQETELLLGAMQTPLFAQSLDPQSLELRGERRRVLINDLGWEGHLIEGPWLTRQNGLHYLFYAGNDFSTPDYGIGVAVADNPFGPFKKMQRPLLSSSASWVGPGHPSVAEDRAGTPHLFFHAFRPGEAGYKAFRALLSARLSFSDEVVEVSC